MTFPLNRNKDMIDYGKLTDDELLNKLKEDEQKAWEYIYKQYKSMVVAYVRDNSGQYEEAEELFTDILTQLKFNLKRGKVNEKGNHLKNLLYTMAKNNWLSTLRKRKNTPTQTDNIPDEAAEANSHHHYWHMLEESLSHIKDKCKELILLKHLNKTPLEEIAVETGYSNAKSVKAALNRCMDKLREVGKEILYKQ